MKIYELERLFWTAAESYYRARQAALNDDWPKNNFEEGYAAGKIDEIARWYADGHSFCACQVQFRQAAQYYSKFYVDGEYYTLPPDVMDLAVRYLDLEV